MELEDIRQYCVSLPGVEECTPFDETTLVYKVMGKMFLLTDIANRGWINLKCDPDKAVLLRERYPEVTPGWHMNKQHWNTVCTEGDLPARLICKWIDDSYQLVVASLPRSKREELSALNTSSD